MERPTQHAEPRIQAQRQVQLYQSIGQGGAADVLLGRLTGPYGFAKLVAVKRLRAGSDDREVVSMLIDEARLGAHIRSPHVVSTLELIEEAGDLYVVMEYVHGESLSRLMRATLRADSLVPVPVALALGFGLLSGLEAVHTASDELGRPLHVVHRDVSPQNLLVGLDGVPRLLDFGIAKARGRLQETRDGVVKGKLGYMSPEQATGGEVDHRTDVYSAAVVLWEALVGDRLFLGATDQETMMAIISGPVVPPKARRPELPRELDEIVMRGLCRDPNGRWPSAGAMASALEQLPIASSSQVGAWVGGLARDELERRLTDLSASPTPTAVLTPGGAVAQPVEPARRSFSWAWWLLALIGLGSTVLGGAVLLRSPTSAPAPVEQPRPVPAVSSGAPMEEDAGLVVIEEKPRPAHPPTERHRPDCRVPYYLDKKGHKRFRTECL